MSNTHNLKVFILAAGRGSRLMPLTRKQPKPLLHFFNKPILYHLIDQVQKEKLGPIMINGHYLGEKIKKALEYYPQNKNISFSLEKNTPMGTAGAYAFVSSWRNNSDLLTINGDIIQNFNLQKLVSAHYKENAFATMLLTQYPLPNETPIWCKNGHVISIGTKPKKYRHLTAHGFSGIQILSNSFIKKIPKNYPSSIISFYKHFILEKKYIHAHICNESWFDLGSPKKYWEAHMLFLKNDWFHKLPYSPFLYNYPDINKITRINITNRQKEIILIRNQQITSSMQSIIGPYVLISGKATLGKDISLMNCLLLNNAIIRDHETLKNMIIDGDLRIPICTDQIKPPNVK